MGKLSKTDQQNNTRAIIKSRKQRNRELVQKVTVEVVDSFVKKEFVDVMQGIRDGLNDLIELNQEQRRAIPEMTNNLQRLLRIIEGTAGPSADKELVKAIYKTLTEISSFYLRGKLRIESQREIRNFLETFKNAELEKVYYDHFQNCMDAVFFGLNEIPDDSYQKFRDRAVLHYPYMEKYFNTYELVEG